jgi:hypothetical protein
MDKTEARNYLLKYGVPLSVIEEATDDLLAELTSVGTLAWDDGYAAGREEVMEEWNRADDFEPDDDEPFATDDPYDTYDDMARYA